MIIAIHYTKGFSQRWIDYCQKHNIPYKLVNCYSNSIIKDLKDCDALMWHFSQDNYRDMLFARQLLFSLQAAGKKVFPDFNTAWHFDDKIGQKYLLEAIGAPLVPTHVFYDKNQALEWVQKTSFPKVFKLRGGAGSANVKLVSSRKQAIKLIKKAFHQGFSQFDRIGYLKERYRKFFQGKDNMLGVFKGLGRLFIPTEYSKMSHREKGYVYFQDYIPNNDSDTRVIVIRDKAFGLKRDVRKNDFRASGSGSIRYEKEGVDERCIKIAFETNEKLKAGCLAYDFVFLKNEPLIVEISYGFAVKAYDPCPGFWDKSLNWHPGSFNPQEWMVDLLIKK